MVVKIYNSDYVITHTAPQCVKVPNIAVAMDA